MRKYLKLMALLLSLVLLAGCAGTPNTEGSTLPSDPSEPQGPSVVYDKGGLDETTTPILMLRINENYWKYVDLTPHLGQENTWVKADIDLKYLVDGINQIAVHSNAYSYGNRTDKSLDIYYSLCMDGAFDSFLSQDVMNTWELQPDRYANIVLELQRQDDDQWETISFQELITQDESVVIGTFVPNGTIFNVCRNLTVESLSGYKAARVAVNLHVGTELMQAPEPEEPDEEDPGHPLDDVAPVLKVKLNNAVPVRLDLTEYVGQDNVWVTVPLSIDKLKNGNNRLVVDSNVRNTADFSSHSVDLYFTNKSDDDSEVSTDGMIYWQPINDRVCNMVLELHNKTTGQWERLGDETFAQDQHTVIGIFSTEAYESPYNMRRTFLVEDMSQYDEVRASINLHVGKTIAEKEDVWEPDVPSDLDTKVPLLMASVNGSAFGRADLTEHLGKNDVWVTVPLDVSKLRTGLNRVVVDSNVDNRSNFSDQSLDLYFTNSGLGDSAVSTDGKHNWMDLNDRVCNMVLELHNSKTGKWEKIGELSFSSSQEHTVIGQFSANSWMEQYHMRRSFQIDSLEGYDDARISVHVHVGSDLALKEE